ncbi:hypothetical protein XcvCFBP7111P_17125 [Xanthomonas citri pv. vignicola]|uniref:Uncharacterized protein n=1 Tax=Xanthomonas citri pv. vignicola TaxID=473426 RepID=A0AB33CGN7_XANCI|nr:hypothetical protein XcvCFBP7111P_17125 [Xanthomonas citri pv. vignicola]
MPGRARMVQRFERWAHARSAITWLAWAAWLARDGCGPRHGASACRGAGFVRMPTARSQAPLAPGWLHECQPACGGVDALGAGLSTWMRQTTDRSGASPACHACSNLPCAAGDHAGMHANP